MRGVLCQSLVSTSQTHRLFCSHFHPRYLSAFPDDQCKQRHKHSRRSQPNTLLVRLQGSALPEKAAVQTYTLSAGLTDAASIERPDKIRPVETTVPYSRNLTIELPPYAVSVIEIVANEIRK